MSEQPDRGTNPAATPVPPARLAPPTRAVERSAWAEEFVNAATATPPRRGLEPSAAETPMVPSPGQPPVEPLTPVEPQPPTPVEPLTPVAPRPPAVPENDVAQAAGEGSPEFTGTDPDSTDPDSTAGIGDQPSDPIQTLPPITATVAGWPISERTGELRRSPLVVAVCGLLLAGAGVAAGTYWWYWWNAINITGFRTSSWLISWFDPRPGSGLSILLVTVMTLIGVVMTAMPAMAAYNAWEGSAWSRRAGLFAAISGLGAIFVMPATWVGFGLCAAGFGLMWLPGFQTWLDAWAEVNPDRAPEITPPTDVPYGPLPRFR